MSTAVSYPYLPPNHTILYSDAANPFMQRAQVLAQHQATDKQHPTGAVIVKDNKIIGEGYNWTPVGFSQWLISSHPRWCVRRFFNIPSGQKYWLCPGCTSNKNHAEARAVNNVATNNHVAEGSDLYLWGHWWCCQPCWEAMIGAGIKDVYLLEHSEVLFNKDDPDNIIGKQS